PDRSTTLTSHEPCASENFTPNSPHRVLLDHRPVGAFHRSLNIPSLQTQFNITALKGPHQHAHRVRRHGLSSSSLLSRSNLRLTHGALAGQARRAPADQSPLHQLWRRVSHSRLPPPCL